jgi:NAD(P)-dependent dehydrogenase (short-subunit alcohol dehydrogenase family)
VTRAPYGVRKPGSALVTGGASGIGRAVARAYHAGGIRVTVLDRTAPREPLPAGITVILGDVSDQAAVAEAVAAASGQDHALDLLTACAGVFDFYARVSELSPEELHRSFLEIYEVNVFGALLAVREATPALRRANGAVTLTLSTAAYQRGGGGALYASSKAALRGLVSHLATELAPEVRVNGVAPGGTGGTHLGGLAALGQNQTADTVRGRDERIRAATLLGIIPRPEDHAHAYLYLARAAAVTGTVVQSDG